MGRCCALAALTAGLALAAPAASHPAALPACVPSGGAPTDAPTGPPSAAAPGACRAADIPESAVPRPPAGGYQHLGATTAGEWSGVSGRFAVRDARVRSRTHDFVAARFMVKRDLGGGEVSWLEAGWAETGWAGDGRQRIYTYDTNSRAWRFYDQYPLRDGDQVWLDLRTDADGVWQAWLWWDGRWNLLTAERLRVGPAAQAEQYVELHTDSRRPAPVSVPPVTVDNVQLKPAGAAPVRYWRDDVPTITDDANPARRPDLCLTWTTHYDTWSAGSCPPGPPGGQPASA
ncbi:hypothetical protein Sya03_29140 [Spirilliplanes yamanashiensis]|uniref:Uncharacterized protein n=1 Tax=Spirilliplanes yamanashiensis TaxID=42233 RepID=A0A8J3Y8W4_9ACTN|nr:hypothetical protein Sya03_29140 [Spirilliplanes yamanashiensis]